jgi:hypothetical protein
MTSRKEISIWFFIGVSLLVNGILIAGAGLFEWLVRPNETRVVLYNLHANVWWGMVLTVIGALYCWKFFPETKSEEVLIPAAVEYEEIHAK